MALLRETTMRLSAKLSRSTKVVRFAGGFLVRRRSRLWHVFWHHASPAHASGGHTDDFQACRAHVRLARNRPPSGSWPERSCRGCEPCSPLRAHRLRPARALTCCGEPCARPAAAVIYFFSIGLDGIGSKIRILCSGFFERLFGREEGLGASMSGY